MCSDSRSWISAHLTLIMLQSAHQRVCFSKLRSSNLTKTACFALLWSSIDASHKAEHTSSILILIVFSECLFTLHLPFTAIPTLSCSFMSRTSVHPDSGPTMVGNIRIFVFQKPFLIIYDFIPTVLFIYDL